jgi:hypothetical protein
MIRQVTAGDDTFTNKKCFFDCVKWMDIMILTVGAATSLFLTKGFIESSTVILFGGDVGKSVMLWWDVVRSSGSTGWHVMSFTRNRCPDARDEWPMLKTCENLVWSANVSCHKFKVPLECFETIEIAGEGSADITSDKLPPFPESSPDELAEPVTWKSCHVTSHVTSRSLQTNWSEDLKMYCIIQIYGILKKITQFTKARSQKLKIKTVLLNNYSLKEYRLLECDKMQPGDMLLTFWKNIPSLFSRMENKTNNLAFYLSCLAYS